MSTLLDVIEPGIPEKDGCPVLRRVKAFVSDEGVAATLRYTFRHPRSGLPIDLDNAFVVAVSEAPSVTSESLEPDDEDDDVVLVKFREFTGSSTARDQCYTVEGVIVDAANGIVDCKIPTAVYHQSGIYTLSWGYVHEGSLKLTQNAVLSIERGLFGFDAVTRKRTEGPPTLGEIRMHMMDSDGTENTLLDDVEFDDEQILQAMVKPIQYFNETNPPLSVRFDTRNFPWKAHWVDAVKGYLLEIAAMHYRRNRLQVTGGGKTLDDKNKEAEYIREGRTLIAEWKDFVLRKKVEINMQACVGSVGSTYSSSWMRN